MFFVSGMAEDGITASYFIRVLVGAGFYFTYISNLDSTTSAVTDAVIVAAAPNAQLTLVSNTSFAGQFVGFHFITPLESGDGSNSANLCWGHMDGPYCQVEDVSYENNPRIIPCHA